MSNKKKVQIIILIFSALAVIFILPSIKWKESMSLLGFSSVVLSTLASIFSLLMPTTYMFTFNDSDWTNHNLSITSKKHGFGNSPKVQIFKKKHNGYEEIFTDSSHDEKGNITIEAANNFCGKVIIS